MKIEVELPIRVNVDNIGAIFLAENQNSSDHTKHVDIRYHFICQYIKDGTIMIECVRSSENDSNIFTKNVTRKTFSRHSEKLIWTKEDYKADAETRILSTGRVLRGIEYNSSMKGKCSNTNEIETTDYTENCETEKKNTEVENDKTVSFVSFDNVKNVG